MDDTRFGVVELYKYYVGDGYAESNARYHAKLDVWPAQVVGWYSFFTAAEIKTLATQMRTAATELEKLLESA